MYMNSTESEKIFGEFCLYCRKYAYFVSHIKIQHLSLEFTMSLAINLVALEPCILSVNE
jgi:hypothetical protein